MTQSTRLTDQQPFGKCAYLAASGFLSLCALDWSRAHHHIVPCRPRAFVFVAELGRWVRVQVDGLDHGGRGSRGRCAPLFFRRLRRNPPNHQLTQATGGHNTKGAWTDSLT